VVSQIPSAGDVNGDRALDLDDLVQLLASWGRTAGRKRSPADLDGNNRIDRQDLQLFLAWLGDRE
jgi:hypothetical protein